MRRSGALGPQHARHGCDPACAAWLRSGLHGVVAVPVACARLQPATPVARIHPSNERANMNLCEDYLESAENRQNFYGLLACIYRKEADALLLEGMKGLAFAGEDAESLFGRGACELDAYLGGLQPNARTDLAVDYARVFLGAGIATSEAAYPYESVYTSEDHLVMQEAHDAMGALLRSSGLACKGSPNEPADHIALELDYMAHLVGQGLCAAEAGNGEAVSSSVASQLAFLREHLLNWVPSFAHDVERYAETGFYRGIGKMTLGFLEMDEGELRRLSDGGESGDAAPAGEVAVGAALWAEGAAS